MVFHPRLRKLAEPSFLPALARKNKIRIYSSLARLAVSPPKQKPPSRAVFVSFLGFLEKHALLERRVELHELDLALHGLLVLARPDDVRRLRGFQLNETDLGHTNMLSREHKTAKPTLRSAPRPLVRRG